MKNKIKQYCVFVLFFILSISTSFSQERIENLRNHLEALSVDVPGLNNTIEDLSVSGVSIQNFVRAIGSTNQLNITVSSHINHSIISNFSNVDVIDVLIYLCKEYSLTLDFVGSIIIVKEYTEYNPKPISKPKNWLIDYNANTDKITLDFKKDSLISVAKAITKATNKNVLYSPKTKNTLITAYIKEKSFDDAMNKLAYANGLSCNYSPDGFYLFEPSTVSQKNEEPSSIVTQKEQAENIKLSLNIDNDGFTLFAEDVPKTELLAIVSNELKENYFLLNDLEGNISISLYNISYEEFLDCILAGSSLLYRKDNSLYLIGDLKNQLLFENEIISIQHRPVENISNIIPEYLKKSLTITEYLEVNSIIASGPPKYINELRLFLRSVDLLVPVVLIEVIIIDQKSDFSISTGINAGLTQDDIQTGGVIYPSVDMTLSSTAINKLIQGFNTYGIINIGNVVPNFYMTIKAMESQGLLSIRSTPKLSTISGQSSKMVIGETAYYIEEQNNVITNQSTQNIITKTYKPVQANFSLSIVPVVTGEDQIFLEITVDQSGFTSKVDPTAPPGQANRSFSSSIRVKNGEMILLGGLEEVSKDDSGSGLPLISRIPVIKWFFSNRNKKTSKTKLGIFIKPTIIR
jgi:type IV pilus assembly protein PilQ